MRLESSAVMRGSLAPSSLTPMAQPFKKAVIAAFVLLFSDKDACTFFRSIFMLTSIYSPKNKLEIKVAEWCLNCPTCNWVGFILTVKIDALRATIY